MEMVQLVSTRFIWLECGQAVWAQWNTDNMLI